MIKRFFLFFLFVIFFAACSSLKVAESVSVNNKYFTIEKVKVKVKTTMNQSITLNGYISIVHDSSICFKFYGPLGMKAISGLFTPDACKIHDYFNKIYYDNIITLLTEKTGIIVNAAFFESILYGNLEKAQIILSDLNINLIIAKSLSLLPIIGKSISGEMLL